MRVGVADADSHHVIPDEGLQLGPCSGGITLAVVENDVSAAR